MDWRPYNECCRRLAAEADAGFCPECGHPLLRCQAFAECKTLVTPDGLAKSCQSCLTPRLIIKSGAAVSAKRGDRLSIPLILINASPAGRSFWVKQVVKKTEGGYEPLRLNWEQIEARSERRFEIDSPQLSSGGTLTAGLILVLGSRYKGVEEQFAFEAGMQISVASESGGNTTYNITNTNSTYYNRTTIEGRPADEGAEAPAELALQPAEVYELEEGIRGYRDTRERVPRHVEFAFSGFPETDRPKNGATIMQTGRLACGRNSRKAAPAVGGLPSDLCLRAYDRKGVVDEPASLAISRHHFDLVVVNDRLCVHARSTRGLELNGKSLEMGELAVLRSGDRLVPIPGRGEKLSLTVDFSASMGIVESVEISRTPALS
jgi:hypothetical protein